MQKAESSFGIEELLAVKVEDRQKSKRDKPETEANVTMRKVKKRKER